MVIFILISLAVSLGALFLFLRLAKSRRGFATVGGLSLIGGFFSVSFFSPAFVLQLIITFIAAIVCLVFNPRRSIVVALMIAAPVVACSVAIYVPLAELNRLARLREEIPLKSLASRLDYEHKTEGFQNVAAEPLLSAETERQLAEFENRDEWNTRRRMLERLHNHTNDAFILAKGFGPIRMMGVYQNVVVLDEAAPVSLQSHLGTQPGSVADQSPDGSHPAARLPETPVLSTLHNEALHDFLGADRLGYVRDVDHVAGFQSHRFTKMPQPAADPKRRWALIRLELIGLLKYDQPKAYVSEFLPRLDELGMAATRDVDAFEQAALDRLQTDENLVIEEAPERIRMVGSLRASNDCLACHNVRRGELVGALTYEIVPFEPHTPIASHASAAGR